jgi:hypothetical protein
MVFLQRKCSTCPRTFHICYRSRKTVVRHDLLQPVCLTCSSEGQLGRKLHEWGVYKYDSKHRMQLQVSAAPYNALDSEGFGPTTTIQTTRQRSSTRSLPPSISEKRPLTASFEQIQDLPNDNWFSSVTRWLDSHEVDIQFNLRSLGYLYFYVLGTRTETQFESRSQQVSHIYKMLFEIMVRLLAMIEPLDAYLLKGRSLRIAGWIDELGAEGSSILRIRQTKPGHDTDQPYCGEVDRMSLDSSPLTDLASLESLSGRIQRNQSSALHNGQECAKIRPSQVMRRTSFASSDLRLFDGISDISSVAAGSDTTN